VQVDAGPSSAPWAEKTTVHGVSGRHSGDWQRRVPLAKGRPNRQRFSRELLNTRPIGLPSRHARHLRPSARYALCR
jgi:hypothetical protein